MTAPHRHTNSPCQTEPAAAAPFETEKCRTCRASIIWTTTVNGKDMPVDAEPTEGGNIRVYRDPAGVIRSDVVKPALAFGRKNLRLCHFVKCPQAPKWRKR